MNIKICYWTIAWGNYAYMAQSLVNSAKNIGIQDDFIVFSDKNLINCINYPLDSKIELNLSNYMFKFFYLIKLLELDYEYFVFIDSDSYFVAQPNISPLDLMKEGNPWHCFLESPINSEKTIRPDWWGVPVKTLTQMYRNLGVINKEIRNVNAGYWICKKSFIKQAYKLGINCYNYFVSNNYHITEEIPMAYITNYMSKNINFHFHENYFNYWASDWTGNFKNIIPLHTTWNYESYMTGEKFKIKHALVHAMRSKNALINQGKF